MRQLRIRNIARPAVREGVLYGIIFGLLLLLISLLANFDAGIAALLTYVILIGGYAYAAYRAARTTKLIKTGIVAGIIAGSLAYFISLLAEMFVVIVNINSIRTTALSAIPVAQRGQYTNQYIIFALLEQYLFRLLILGTLAGALFGAVGGLMGRRSRSVATVTPETTAEDVSDTSTVDATVASVEADELTSNVLITEEVQSPQTNGIAEASEPVSNEYTTETVEPIQHEIPVEEVESSPNEVPSVAIAPALDEPSSAEAGPIAPEPATPAKVESAQDETVEGVEGEAMQDGTSSGKVLETPVPTLKKNYRKFLSN